MIAPVRAVVASGGALKVSMLWLTVSYILQTIGELSLSPVGLSSMTKLAPAKFGGQMMGVWFLAASLGNLIAGIVGGDVDPEKLEAMTPLFVRTTASLFIAAVLCALLVESDPSHDAERSWHALLSGSVAPSSHARPFAAQLQPTSATGTRSTAPCARASPAMSDGSARKNVVLFVLLNRSSKRCPPASGLIA